jgi:hypothetical protein
MNTHSSSRLIPPYTIRRDQLLTSVQFPFNNACNPSNSMLTNLNFSGLKVEMARDTNRHVKKTLPPSFGGFPGMADIKYFVKATVIRPQFYKENIRAVGI